MNKSVLRQGQPTKTGPPPAPTADVSGAGQLVLRMGFNGPGMTPKMLERGIDAPPGCPILLFWYPVTFATS